MKNNTKIIHVYWYGNSSKKEQLINYYKKINKIISPWKIEVGPNQKEHEYLLKNNKFYKKCFDNEIFAFCSDIWRLYKIYKDGGLYIDAGCTFNESKIKSFLNELEQYDYAFVLETPLYLWNGMFWFKYKNNKLLLETLNYTNKLVNSNFNHIITGPICISKFIFKNFGYKLENNPNILLLKSCKLSPNNKDNIIYMRPSASWWSKINTKMKRTYDVKQSWEYSYNSFNKEYKVNWLLVIKRKILIKFSKLFTYWPFNKLLSLIKKRNKS